jgi:hypothetical protein
MIDWILGALGAGLFWVVIYGLYRLLSRLNRFIINGR